MKQTLTELAGATLLLVVLVGGAYVIDRVLPRSLDGYAREVMRECAGASYVPACYDQAIPRLMDRGLSMEEAFTVTSIIQEETDGYFYCHVLGHNLATKETAKDPDAWTSVIARCPTGMCSNGCLHGAAQERFRADALPREEALALIPELAPICEAGREYTELERASCYHSLGHLTMYLTGAHVETATQICEAIATQNNRSRYAQTCYDGVYMQIFQPLEPEDVALVAHIPVTDVAAAEAYCDTFSGSRRASCHRESWPLYGDTLQTPDGLARFCSLTPGIYHELECYYGMFYGIAAQLNFDADRIESFCSALPEKRAAPCFANAASRLIETDYRLIPDAVAMCERAEQRGMGKRCWDELLYYSTFNFHRGSEGFNRLCAALPEPWKTQCVDGTGPERYPNATDF